MTWAAPKNPRPAPPGYISLRDWAIAWGKAPTTASTCASIRGRIPGMIWRKGKRFVPLNLPWQFAKKGFKR